MSDVDYIDIDINTEANSDCGGIAFEWNCPQCGEHVAWAPSMWWSLKCNCGAWDFVIKAIAPKQST